ncbi:MAG: hypothetical protein P794_04060 [Epsilonproteobacteria bacterium (ex Lamellibrachia satsuma)]|nr:MAG: hypothetical protein P794_04060 [Epsilonproteobacteria bacterium (ex Lamellibrachia satsuma)]
MRLNEKPLGFVINFLLGAAWAFVLMGAVTSFLSFYQDSFIVALISALIGALPGLIGVLVMEYFITDKEKLSELKRQTELLEKLADQKEG